jgi:hypothetical protein
MSITEYVGRQVPGGGASPAVPSGTVRLRLWEEWLVKYKRAWNDRLDRWMTTSKNCSNKESSSDI